MTPETRHDFDAAIDEAARHLTAVEPRAFMASRVAARLREQRRSHWRSRVMLTAGAAATIAALALFVRGPASKVESPSTGAASVMPSQSAVPDNTDVVSAPSVRVAAAPPRATTRRPAPQAANPDTEIDAAVDAAWRARAVPALAEPDPIAGEVIQPEPIDLPLLELKPLETTPLHLARLQGGRQ